MQSNSSSTLSKLMQTWRHSMHPSMQNALITPKLPEEFLHLMPFYTANPEKAATTSQLFARNTHNSIRSCVCFEFLAKRRTKNAKHKTSVTFQNSEWEPLKGFSFLAKGTAMATKMGFIEQNGFILKNYSRDFG